MKLRKFPVLSNLPEAIEQEKVVSLLPEYRTYITKKCFGCGNLFWMRKDHELRSDKPACSSRCGHIVQGHHVNH
jgi:hypothetical protein